MMDKEQKFQSTPSAWRATFREISDYTGYSEDISIHALRMEGDRSRSVQPIKISGFQSTPSAWRATLYDKDY